MIFYWISEKVADVKKDGGVSCVSYIPFIPTSLKLLQITYSTLVLHRKKDRNSRETMSDREKCGDGLPRESWWERREKNNVEIVDDNLSAKELSSNHRGQAPLEDAHSL